MSERTVPNSSVHGRTGYSGRRRARAVMRGARAGARRVPRRPEPAVEAAPASSSSSASRSDSTIIARRAVCSRSQSSSLQAAATADGHARSDGAHCEKPESVGCEAFFSRRDEQVQYQNVQRHLTQRLGAVPEGPVLGRTRRGRSARHHAAQPRAAGRVRVDILGPFCGCVSSPCPSQGGHSFHLRDCTMWSRCE
jgi:hypothetical protein